jgi:Cu+-exporting ATPase
MGQRFFFVDDSPPHRDHQHDHDSGPGHAHAPGGGRGSAHDHSHEHGRAHEHDHGHSHGAPGWAYALFCAAVAVLLVLYVTGVFTRVGGFDVALLLTVVAGFPLLRHAIEDLLRGHFSSHLTIAIAAGAAVAIGEYFAAAEVMFIMLLGEGLEHFTVDRARRAIAGFVESQPRRARVLRAGVEVEIAPEEVRVGEIVRVRPGEKVPVDGRVRGGVSTVDQSRVTGEPIPAEKRAGDPIWSGSVNEYGALEIEAERVGADTTVARIARLIDEAQRRRAPIVRVADRMARFFLPAALIASAAIYFATGEMMRTVAALIVACPCALVLATPAAMAAAIARLGRQGVLVKGGETIERLAAIDSVAFDKTGTLTVGRPALVGVDAAAGFGADAVLRLAAAAEQPSEHLLGRALVEAARARGFDLPAASSFEMRPGLGVKATVEGREVTVGSPRLLEAGESAGKPHAIGAEDRRGHGFDLAAASANGQTPVVAMIDGRPAGLLRLRDPLRPEAAEAIAELATIGVERVVMLTGDEEGAAGFVARAAGIDEVHARLLPEDKLRRLRTLRGEGAKVLMAGDGVNDAPSLAAAEVGAAMGRGAADLSAEAAQVVFLRDRLDQIPPLLVYARTVLRRIRSSILVFAFGVNFAAVGAAAFGWLTPAWAAIVHQGASLAVILNCVRLLFEGRAVEPDARRSRAARVLDRLREVRHTVVDHGGEWLRRGIARWRWPVLRWALWAVVPLWLTTGLVAIGPAEVGLELRFGRLAGEALQPGLHWRLPWPLARIERIEPRRVRAAEVGFRTQQIAGGAVEPVAYEWNTRHDTGRYRPVLEESLMLTGDENLVEVYGVAHYSVADPAAYLLAARDAGELVRVTAETSLRWTVARLPLDAVLTGERRTLEQAWSEALQAALARYGLGVEVASTHLIDAHPPLEVVEAFREVASANEERTRAIDEAEGYKLERIPLARGEAQGAIHAAEGYAARLELRSIGDAAAFRLRAREFAAHPDVTRHRLYLETIESVLPGKKKFIAASGAGGRRRFLYLEPGEAQPPLTVLDSPAAAQGGFPEEDMEQQP